MGHNNEQVVNMKEPQDIKEESYMLQMFHEPDPGAPDQPEIEQPRPSTSETLHSKKRKCSQVQGENKNTDDDFSIFGAFVASEIRGLRHDSTKKKLKCSIMKAVLNAIEEDREGTPNT
jgi:hypothetical protein